MVVRPLFSRTASSVLYIEESGRGRGESATFTSTSPTLTLIIALSYMPSVDLTNQGTKFAFL